MYSMMSCATTSRYVWRGSTPPPIQKTNAPKKDRGWVQPQHKYIKSNLSKSFSSSRHHLTPYEGSNSTRFPPSWRRTAGPRAISNSWRVVDRFPWLPPRFECCGQFSIGQAIYSCNNQQSHSTSNLILHESLWIRGRKHSVCLELESTAD